MFVRSVEVRKPITLGNEFVDDDTEPKIIAHMGVEGKPLDIVISGSADEIDQLIKARSRAVSEARGR